MPGPHLETQQHLSKVLCVNLQTNLPSLISQQRSFTSFPVSPQTIFFGAAQHPTSNSEKKFASPVRRSEPPATFVSSIQRFCNRSPLTSRKSKRKTSRYRSEWLAYILLITSA